MGSETAEDLRRHLLERDGARAVVLTGELLHALARRDRNEVVPHRTDDIRAGGFHSRR